jgi:hypothetical protein
MNKPNELNPSVWGPHYWFFLHTMAMTYPKSPNDVVKKKYYRFIQDLPLFLPGEKISNHFQKILNLYPVTPYLDSRDSFILWTWFIHNKINEYLEKPTISLQTFYENYYEKYKPVAYKNLEFFKMKRKFIYLLFLILLFFVIYYFYNR